MTQLQGKCWVVFFVLFCLSDIPASQHLNKKIQVKGIRNACLRVSSEAEAVFEK